MLCTDDIPLSLGDGPPKDMNISDRFGRNSFISLYIPNYQMGTLLNSSKKTGQKVVSSLFYPRHSLGYRHASDENTFDVRNRIETSLQQWDVTTFHGSMTCRRSVSHHGNNVILATRYKQATQQCAA